MSTKIEKSKSSWKPELIRCASVYRFGHGYVITSSRYSRIGLRQEAPPYYSVPGDATPLMIARNIQKALRNADLTYPNRKPTGDSTRSFLRLCKAKRWVDVDPMALVSIDQLPSGTWQLWPMYRDGLGHLPVRTSPRRIPPARGLKGLTRGIVLAIAESEAMFVPRRRRPPRRTPLGMKIW